jgi:diaminohydroxyphosphoribosylaminopyrimidine deaminase/5-amino-6-(5-phosphoribosylamino)uracil reductase
VLAGRRVVLPGAARLLRDGMAPTWVIVPRGASRAAVARLRRRGVEVIEVAGRAGGVAFEAAVKALGARGITRLLVEGGGAVAAAALRARAVDEVAIFVAPVVIGADGVAAIGPLAVRALDRAVRLRRVRVERIGSDLLVRGHVHYPR